MSDPRTSPPPARPPLISGDLFGNIPQLVYLLYMVGFILHPAALVGVVLAYVHRNDADAVARSHYDFQISTFWRGLAVVVLGAILFFVLIGWAVLLFWLVWTLVRCINGLSS